MLNTQVTYCINKIHSVFVWAWIHIVHKKCRLSAKHSGHQAKGLTCWQHNDRHKEMQISSFCYLMGMKNTQMWILMMPWCLFVLWEMDIKGKTEKHQRLRLSTQTWAFVSDWWSKKFRHADLPVFWRRRLSLSIHLKPFILLLFFLSTRCLSLSLTLFLSLCFSHFCLLRSIS